MSVTSKRPAEVVGYIAGEAEAIREELQAAADEYWEEVYHVRGGEEYQQWYRHGCRVVAGVSGGNLIWFRRDWVGKAGNRKPRDTSIPIGKGPRYDMRRFAKVTPAERAAIEQTEAKVEPLRRRAKALREMLRQLDAYLLLTYGREELKLG